MNTTVVVLARTIPTPRPIMIKILYPVSSSRPDLKDDGWKIIIIFLYLKLLDRYEKIIIIFT